MHNIDRTNLESNYGAFSGEYEAGDGYEFESDQEFETYGPFSEAEEIEMAAELLSVSSDAELDQFLGNLIKTAGRVSRSATAIQSPTSGVLGGRSNHSRSWRWRWTKSSISRDCRSPYSKR
jgi:hypothetical protein